MFGKITVIDQWLTLRA